VLTSWREGPAPEPVVLRRVRRHLVRDGHEPVLLTHDDTDLQRVDALVVAEAPPGVEAADGPVRFPLAGQIAVGITRGMPVLGLGEGLGLLCGGGFLPGTWRPGEDVPASTVVVVVTRRTAWTSSTEPGEQVALTADGAWAPSDVDLDTLRARDQVVLRSSGGTVVGVCNPDGNVVGVAGLPSGEDGTRGLTTQILAMLDRVPLEGHRI